MKLKNDDISEITRAVADRIKKLRMSKGLTLQELSSKCGLSTSMLSKIENARVFPSLSTYAKIASCFNMTVGVLIVDSEQKYNSISIVRSNERMFISYGPYIGSPLAFRKDNRKMEPFLYFYPMSKIKPKPFQHEYEEMIFVLEGKIKFKYGEEIYILEKGDCAYFDGRIPHFGFSFTKKGAQVLVIQSR